MQNTSFTSLQFCRLFPTRNSWQMAISHNNMHLPTHEDIVHPLYTQNTFVRRDSYVCTAHTSDLSHYPCRTSKSFLENFLTLPKYGSTLKIVMSCKLLNRNNIHCVLAVTSRYYSCPGRQLNMPESRWSLPFYFNRSCVHRFERIN